MGGSVFATLAALGLDLLFADSALANGPWGGYANGYIPLSALDIVSYPGVVPYQYSSAALPSVYMAPGASDRLLSLLQNYHADTGGYLRVAEGYRSYAGQVYWYNQGNGGTPGHSNHGWGQAVDFDSGLLTSAQLSWLSTNGPMYYFFPLAGDLGHYNYTGPVGQASPTTNGQGDTMLGSLVYHVQSDPGQPATGLSGAWFLMSAVSIVNVTSSLGAYLASRLNCDTIAQAQASGGQPITISQQGLDYIAAGLGAPDQILESLYVSSTNKIWRA